jgi:hypothetical protein
MLPSGWNRPLDREWICEWTHDDTLDVWSTACGELHVLIEGTPKQNSMCFCCYCGKRLEEKRE